MSRFGKLFIPMLLFVLAMRIASWSFATNACADVFSSGHSQISQLTDHSLPIGSDAAAMDLKMTKRHRRARPDLHKFFVALPEMNVFVPGMVMKGLAAIPDEPAPALLPDSVSRPPCC